MERLNRSFFRRFIQDTKKIRALYYEARFEPSADNFPAEFVGEFLLELLLDLSVYPSSIVEAPMTILSGGSAKRKERAVGDQSTPLHRRGAAIVAIGRLTGFRMGKR